MTAWRDYRPTVDDVIASCEDNARESAKSEAFWRERRDRCVQGTKELAEACLQTTRHFHERRHWLAMAAWYRQNRDKPMCPYSYGDGGTRLDVVRGREPGQEG